MNSDLAFVNDLLPLLCYAGYQSGTGNPFMLPVCDSSLEERCLRATDRIVLEAKNMRLGGNCSLPPPSCELVATRGGETREKSAGAGLALASQALDSRSTRPGLGSCGCVGQ